MNAIPSTLYTAAFTLCLFSAGILRDRQSRADRSHDFLTAFLVLEAFGFVFELLLAHPAMPLKALWLASRMSTSLLLAPCVWLALREIVEGTRPRISALSRGHLWAVAGGALLTLPLLATAHLGEGISNPDRPVSALHSRVIHTTMFLCMVVFGVQIPCYLLRCRRLLREMMADRGDATRDPARRGGNSGAWLHLPLLAVFATWAVGLARTLHCAVLHGAAGYAPWFAFAEVSMITCAIYLLANRASSLVPVSLRREAVVVAETSAAAPVIVPPVVEPQPTLPAAPVDPVVHSTPAGAPADAGTARYAKSVLAEKSRERIRQRLEAAMVNDRLFCNSLLSLESLSRAIHENKHAVSQVLNQDLGMNFFEFVARHRVDAAKNLLRQHPEQTVLAIALAVGFNAKSTFNTAFRRVTGLTPKAFRAELD